MIRSLRGTIIEKTRHQLILEVGGVGYDVSVTPVYLARVTIGDEAKVAISESIREDGHDLYGFASTAERDSFEQLRKVSGVGPKAALAIAGFYSPNDLASIIETGDSKKLSLVPSIGPKLASKIIVELKDKLMPEEVQHLSDSDDTVEALRSLGYTPSEIVQMLAKVPNNLASTSERITWILRHYNT